MKNGEHMSTIYVLSAVPPNSNRLLRKYGLLSGIETIKHPDVLEAARPDAKQRRAFVKKVKEVIASDRPHSVMGPSVFFTPPDPEKITNKHFIKKWDLQTIRIDLGRLIEDYPDTIVWGAELLPYDKAWRKMSDEEFDDVMADMGYASWEDFAAERSRALTLDEVREFTQMRPEDLWEHYAKSDAGKMYASNVPHAFIITPMGYIPYEYIEYVDEARENPLEPSTKVQFSPDGYLINPLDGTTVWWHGYSYDVETLVRAGDIDDEDLESLEQSDYVEDKEFLEGGMNWAGVFFTPSREDAVMFARQHEYDTQFIVSARIRKCKIFDAREHSRYDLEWDTYEDEDVVSWLKAEGFEGYIELESDSDTWFNVCIFNAPKYVEIIKNTNIARPENYLRLRTSRGRKNPKDYIINPNTGGRIWWYVTDERRPEFRTGDEAHRFTWFGGVREDWEDFGEFNLALTKKYLLEVQIEAPAGCAVFDARTLFPSVPQWVEDSLRKSTQIDDEDLDSEEGYEFLEIVRPMPIEADTYRFFQNMRIADPSLNAFCSTFNSDWLRTEFLIKLWLLDWASVQDFLEKSKYTEEVDTPIVGWYEIERGDYNYHTAINLGLYMAKPANLASHFQRCSDIKVDIVNVISAK